MLVALGETDRAESLSRELLQMNDRDARSDHFAYHFLADCALLRGDCAEAEKRYRESLRAALPLGDFLETSFEVQGVAMSLAGLGVGDRALHLAAAAKAEWERIGADVHMRFWDELMDRYLGGARRALGGEAADHAWANGKLIPFDEAVAIALESRGGIGAAGEPESG